MTGAPARVAVRMGAAAVRVAAADRGGDPRLLAEEPAAEPERVRTLLTELLGGPPDELIVVGATAGPCADLAATVRVVPAALSAGGPGRGLVVDVGHRRAEVTLLDADGRVLGVRHAPGGAQLDAVVAELARVPEGPARQLREALSLLPQAVVRGADRDVVVRADQVRAVIAPLLDDVVTAARTLVEQVRVADAAAAGPGGSPGGPDGQAHGAAAGVLPVLLVGGVARTPLLAELFDAAAIGPVTVAARPEAAAVLGALRLPEAVLPAPLDPGPAPLDPGPAPLCGPAGDPPRLPPPPRRSRVPRAAATLLAAAALAALAAVWPSAAPVVEQTGIVAQYGYAMRLPDGWAHTGGLPERRRTLLTPAGAPDGSDLVVVERTPLGYDAAAEPERAAADLRAAFDAAVATAVPLADFVASARYGGRPVATYRQHGTGGMIDWYVLLDLPDQITVGCQHTPTGEAEVERACAVVVGSVTQG